MELITDLFFEPVTLNLDQIGYWPNPGITWLGPQIAPLALTSTVQRLSDQLSHIVSLPTNSEFRPHVTLLRNSRPTKVFNFEPVTWSASNLVVVESQLLPEGVRYTQIAGSRLVKQ